MVSYLNIGFLNVVGLAKKKPIPSSQLTSVINNVFRDWGHQFLYDAKMMEITLQKAGFTNVQQYSVGESDNENLRGIESHGKNVNSEEMAAFETMVHEGTCPA